MIQRSMQYFCVVTCMYLFVAILLPATGIAEKKVDPKLVAKVAEGADLFAAEQVDEALKLAKQVVRKDRYYGPGQELLAKCYISKGGMQSFQRAREAIGKAIRAEPKNADFYVTFADLEVAQGHKQLALGHIRRGVSLAPDNVNATKTLIDLLEGELEFYHHKISAEIGLGQTGTMPEESIPALFDPNILRHLQKNNPAAPDGPRLLARTFENRSRFEAGLDRYAVEVEDLVNEVRFYYIQMLNFHPDDFAARDGYFTLLLRFYLFDELGDVTLSFLKKRKLDPTVLLYHGLSLYLTGNYPQAEQDFRAAFMRMTPEDRAPYESIEWLLQADERLQYLGLGASERLAQNQEFWNQRDPLLISSSNERQLEHWARVAEANCLFQGDNPEDAGWKSDKGIVFIKYGRPERELRITRDVRKFQSQEGVRLDSRGRRRGSGSVMGWSASNFSTSKTIDYWLYPDYSFRFENYDGVRNSNNFTFATFDMVDFEKVLKEEERRIPEATQLALELEPVSIRVATATFRGANGKTRMEIYFDVPSLEDKTTGDEKTVQDLLAGVFFFDETSGERSGSPRSIRAKAATTIRWPSEVPPGEYRIVTELQNTATKRVGRYTGTLTAPDYHGGELLLSDVVLAENAEIDVDRLDIRDGIVFAPRVNGRFTPDEPVYVYYEIYNLIPESETLISRYEVAYAVRLLPDTGGLFGFARKLLGQDGDQSSVTTSVQYEGNRPTAYNFLDVRSIGLGIGEHELVVRVTDLNSDRVVEQTARFTITASDTP